MPEDGEFSGAFLEWLTETAGVPKALLLSLDKDDDWTFVIKMFGILEAGINRLIATKMDNPKAAEVIARLETANDRKGKVALIKAYGLLSDDSCGFVKQFATLRSHAVHNVKHFGLNLDEYIENDTQNREKWKTSLTSWCDPPVRPNLMEAAFRFPRQAIHNSVMRIMIVGMLNHFESYKWEAELARFAERAKSTPRE